MAAPAPPRQRFAGLRGREFVLLWLGQTVSSFGTAVTLVALPLVAVVALHASTFEVGVVSAAGFAAWLFLGLPAGVWVDRLPRRPMLVACDAARALALVSVPVAWAIGRLTLAQLVVVALVVGCLTVLFDIAFWSFLPSVLSTRQLLAGNSTLQGSQSVAQVAGPAIGGGIVTLVGAPMALLADVCSYLVSVGCLVSLRTRETPPPKARSASMLTQMREGLGFVVHHPILGPLTIGTANLNMFEAAQEALFVVFLVRTVHVAPGVVGALLTSIGAGGVIGAALAGPLSARLGSARTLLVAVTVGPLVALLVPLTVGGAGLLFFVVGALFVNGLTVVFSIVVRSYRQTVSPPHLLGRVTATTRFLTWGVAPIGALVGGALGQALGNRAALWVVGGCLLLTPLIVAATPVGRMRDLPGVTDEPTVSAVPASAQPQYAAGASVAADSTAEQQGSMTS